MGSYNGYWTDVLSEALGRKVEVVDDHVAIGFSMGLAFYLETEEGKYYSAYYDEAAGDACCEHAIARYLRGDRAEWVLEELEGSFAYHTGEDSEAVFARLDSVSEDAPPECLCPCDQSRARCDPAAWLDSMQGATDWANWDWDKWEEIPIIY